MKTNRVVITGMGALTPIGNNVKEFKTALFAGKSGSDWIRRFDTEGFKTKFACEVKDYQAEDYFEKKELRKLDRYSQYALVAVDEAVKNANVHFQQLNREKVGVIWASGIGGFETFEENVEEHYKNGSRYNPFFIHKILPDTAAGLISIKYGLMGVNFNPVSACASASNAIIEAFNYLQWGKYDMIIAGGSEAPITRASIHGFNAMKALSENNDEYISASRPFDSSRDGFVAGEGSGALIIETLEHAQRRNAPILAEIVGGGLSSDAYHITGTHPEGQGAYLSMKWALEEARLHPSDIDYLNAHATSTPPGDISEIRAIVKLFAGSYEKLHISATKSLTGHLLGASGAIEAVACVLSILEGRVPSTIHSKNIDEQIPKGMNLTLGKSVDKTIDYALSNNFGFGGHNASLVFKRWMD